METVSHLVTQSGLYPYPASSAAWPTLLIHVFCVKFLLGTHCCLVFCLFFLFFGVDFRLLWGQVFSMFCLLLFFSIQNRAWSIKRHFYFCQFFFFFKPEWAVYKHTQSCYSRASPHLLTPRGDEPREKREPQATAVCPPWQMAERDPQREAQMGTGRQSYAVIKCHFTLGGCGQCPGGCAEMSLHGPLEAIGLP